MIKGTILLIAMLPVMAGAIIAASLPLIAQHFAAYPQGGLYARLMLTLPALFVACTGPLVGYLIDRFHSRPVLLWGLLVFSVAGSSGLWLTDPVAMLAGRALLGVSIACIITSNTTLIGDLFSGPQRNAIMGQRGAFMSLGGFLFVSLGGLLADWHWRAPFAVYFIALPFFVLTWAVLPDLKKDRTTEPQKVDVPLSPTGQTGLILGASFFGMLMFYLIPVELPFFLRHRFYASGATIGLSIGLTTLFGALASLTHKKIIQRVSFARIQSLSFVLIGIGYLGLQFSTSSWMIWLALVPAGLGSGLMMPNFTLWLMSVTPAAFRGKYMGRLTFFIFIGQFCAPFLVMYTPPTWGHYSFAATLLFTGSALLFWQSYRAVDARD